MYEKNLGASPQLEYLPAIDLAQARGASWINGVMGEFILHKVKESNDY